MSPLSGRGLLEGAVGVGAEDAELGGGGKRVGEGRRRERAEERGVDDEGVRTAEERGEGRVSGKGCKGGREEEGRKGRTTGFSGDTVHFRHNH